MKETNPDEQMQNRWWDRDFGQRGHQKIATILQSHVSAELEMFAVTVGLRLTLLTMSVR